MAVIRYKYIDIKMKKNEVISLVLSASLIVFLHFFYFREICYDRDLAVYAYNSLSVLKGQGWYYTIWHTKPPGINFIILAAFKLFGNSLKSIYLAALFFNLLSLFFIYLLSKLVLSKEMKLYFLLPVFFALIFAAEPFMTYAANTEVFLAPFEIGGILFLGLNQYFISGLFLGMGFLIRQSGIYTFFAGLLFIVVINSLEKDSFKKLIKNLTRYITAFILPLVLISLYFLRLGVFDKFFDNSFILGLRNMGEYVVDIRHKDLISTLNTFWSMFDFEIIFFGISALLGLYYAITRKTKTSLLFSLWFVAICSGLSISAIYRHHFIQLIAPLACISLLALWDDSGSFNMALKNNYSKRQLICALAIILFTLSFRVARPFLTKTRVNFPSYVKEDRYFAAEYIKEHTSPQDKIFVWDSLNATSIILWSGRDSITRYYEKNAFLPFESKDNWVHYMRSEKEYLINQKQLLLDIQQYRPKYIVVVKSYTQFIRWKHLVKEDATASDWQKALQESIEAEKKAFPEFFQMLDTDYQLEETMFRCLIYKRVN